MSERKSITWWLELVRVIIAAIVGFLGGGMA